MVTKETLYGKDVPVCPDCLVPLGPDGVCPNCGKKLQDFPQPKIEGKGEKKKPGSKLECPNCGFDRISENDIYCPKCGAKLVVNLEVSQDKEKKTAPPPSPSSADYEFYLEPLEKGLKGEAIPISAKTKMTPSILEGEYKGLIIEFLESSRTFILKSKGGEVYLHPHFPVLLHDGDMLKMGVFEMIFHYRSLGNLGSGGGASSNVGSTMATVVAGHVPQPSPADKSSRAYVLDALQVVNPENFKGKVMNLKKGDEILNRDRIHDEIVEGFMDMDELGRLGVTGKDVIIKYANGLRYVDPIGLYSQGTKIDLLKFGIKIRNIPIVIPYVENSEVVLSIDNKPYMLKLNRR